MLKITFKEALEALSGEEASFLKPDRTFIKAYQVPDGGYATPYEIVEALQYMYETSPNNINIPKEEG
ncbi:MAG: hypothetical protein LBT80_01645 [Lactobacillaceae bacterium]|jgi:hypothetical protein|nr:hypothetical protein [Lactobacillaceae bacterium]